MMNRRSIIAATAVGLPFLGSRGWAQPQPPKITNLGMVGIQSAWGAYLQAHLDGELHASNPKRNEEETWFLISLDPKSKTVALQNWRNHQYLSKHTNGCAPAVATVIGPTETWLLESSRPFGVQNAVIIRNASDRTTLGTNDPGKNDGTCKGEVTSRDVWGRGGQNSIPMNNSGWGGWWVITGAKTPTAGEDFWNTAGKTLNGITSNINPVDAAMIFALFL
jgi:hypothetical protein